MKEVEEWLYKKAKEVEPELELPDLYTDKLTFGGRWVMDLLEEYANDQLALLDVSKLLPTGDDIWIKATETSRFNFEDWWDKLVGTNQKTAPKTTEQKADKIIKMLEGFTPDEMLEILQLVRLKLEKKLNQ